MPGPFTTLRPQLGVVRMDDREFVLADLPGLIEGASEGAGLGTRFLGHVERCKVLLHLVDVNEADVAEAYRTVRRELKAYGGGLEKRRELVALSECDAADEETIQAKSDELHKAARKKPMLLSAVAGTGMTEALRKVAKYVAESPLGDAPDARPEVNDTDTGDPRDWDV